MDNVSVLFWIFGTLTLAAFVCGALACVLFLWMVLKDLYREVVRFFWTWS